MSIAVGKGGLVAALDVGSSKVCCFVARQTAGGYPNIVGIGQQASKGVKNGTIVGLEEAEGAIRAAVHAAEQMAGETIDRVIVNLSGGYPVSSSIGVEVSIDGHEVGETDLRHIFERGRQADILKSQSDSGRQMIHSIPTGYSIDGNRGIRNPLGMYGDSLGVSLHIITAASGAVRNLASSVQRCHLDPVRFVVSPYASGLSCLVEDEKELGVTVIDMGGGTTTIAVFYEGNPIYTDLIPVGGNHVTSDVARGLSTSLTHAERIKTLYGHAMTHPGDARDMIDVPRVGETEDDPGQQIPRSLLIGIIQPRLEETFELVRSRLETSGFDKISGRRVVLTGGACQMPGLGDLAALVLDKQVRIGRPTRVTGLAEATAGPAYSTCCGLLHYALGPEESTLTEIEASRKEEAGGLIGRLESWFREHF
ncbi:MAG TPA: cell division protein FtsA [Kiloniellaceae bacterium]|nr:cell division protein FtsA [Kiloniellaceae bacterium]